jgi:hypothetical protein
MKKEKQLFSILDLAEGKCAVINDGTVEELNEVLRLAFNFSDSSGIFRYYQLGENDKYFPTNTTYLPIQSVKDFLNTKQNTMKNIEKMIKIIEFFAGTFIILIFFFFIGLFILNIFL